MEESFFALFHVIEEKAKLWIFLIFLKHFGEILMLSGSMSYKIDQKWSREKSDGYAKKNRFSRKIPSQNGTKSCENPKSSRSLAPTASRQLRKSYVAERNSDPASGAS